MPTYLAFLRAINLGAKRKFPMAELRACLEKAGYQDVATHIQTGNVRVAARQRDRNRIEADLERLFLEDRGFEVPTIAFSRSEWRQVADDVDDLAGRATGRHFVSLLKTEPDPEVAAAFETLSTEAEMALVRGRAVHLLVGDSYQAARLDNVVVERYLGVATNRTAGVVRTLAEKWC
jgi:uncharacterized protein (DUF1697 family)